MKGTGSIFAILLFTWGINVSAQDQTFYQLSFQGINHAYNMEFDKGLVAFESLINREPGHSHGHLLKSVSRYYMYLIDMSDKRAEDEFRKCALKTIEVAKKRLFENKEDVDALFHLGTIHMYMAAYYGENNSWLRAYWYGKEGISYLKSAIQLNPQYYDAYLGLGLYHYYADVLPKFVKAVSFLLGVEADRIRGLEELNKVKNHGTFTSTEARFFLAYIYLYLEKRYEPALALLKELSETYPQNVVFQIVLGDAYRKTGRHDQAIATYQNASTADKANRFPQLVNSAVFLMGNIYFEKNEFTPAIDAYARAVERAATKPTSKDGIYAWGLYKQGECYDILGNREKAVGFYQRVKKEHNKFAHAKAQKMLQQPMQRIDAELVKGRNYLITRKFNDAIALYEHIAMRIESGEAGFPASRLPEVYYQIGRTKLEKKAYREAIDEFQKVLTINKFADKWIKPWTHYKLGKCYQNLGDVRLAVQQYKLAYKYDDGELRFEIDKINHELKSAN